ncbi:stonustoxin subunit beta-like, partial [Sardina pilchardus]|uniref:stonustoxin subunit beta-like n=1 Tax=Sardina pilchardus TaxID=27697 RepID=UPI002E137CB2
ELTLDPNTAASNLCLSKDNKAVTHVSEEQPYPDHPDRFDSDPQVLCRESLSGRCYWEAEWNGDYLSIGVTYKSIQRKGNGYNSRLGDNDKSWTVNFQGHRGYIHSACHNKKKTDIFNLPPCFNRVGVFLDWPAGTLSFYGVSSDTLTHLHTFHSTFTEPLYPGFRCDDSAVRLCQII